MMDYAVIAEASRLGEASIVIGQRRMIQDKNSFTDFKTDWSNGVVREPTTDLFSVCGAELLPSVTPTLASSSKLIDLRSLRPIVGVALPTPRSRYRLKS